MTRYTSGAAALLAGAVLCAGGTAPARAQEPRTAVAPRVGVVLPGSMGIPQPEPQITLMMQQKSLGRVLYEVFKQTPYKYQVLADLGNALFSVNADHVPLTQVLKQVLAEDKSQEPLVFGFTRNLAGGGTFTIDREYVDVSSVDGEPRVSVGNGRLTTVLPEVFKKMGVKYRIEPDVPPLLMSLQLRPTDWSEVLPQVIIEAQKQEPTLTYSLDGDTYVVHIQKTPATANRPGADAGAARRVSVNLTNAPLRDAIGAILKGSPDWKYQVSDAVKDVPITFSASNAPELLVLQNVLKVAALNGEQLTYREGKGVLFIEPGPPPGQATLKIVRPAGTGGRLSLMVKQERLQAVAQRLGTAAGTTISVAPNVPNLPVTFSVQDATLDEALKALLTAAHTSLPNLSVRPLANNRFILELK